MTETRKINEFLRRKLQETNMSVNQLSARIGVTRYVLNAILEGDLEHNTQASSVMKIVDTLGIRKEYEELINAN